MTFLPERVAVVGLGNVLMGDDGFGPFAVESFLALYEAGPGVSVQDLGTPGLNLVPFVCGIDALLILDTVRGSGPPGSWRRYDRDALLSKPLQPRTNPHDPGVKEALLNAEVLGAGPRDVVLLGVVPDTVGTGTELTPAVLAAVDPVVEAAAEVLASWGHAPRRRSRPVPPNCWWLPVGHPVSRSG